MATTPDPPPEESTSAALRALGITEILEAILCELPMTDIARCELVSTRWYDVISESPKLNQICFFTSTAEDLAEAKLELKSASSGRRTTRYSARMVRPSTGTDLWTIKAGRRTPTEYEPTDRLIWNPIIPHTRHYSGFIGEIDLFRGRDFGKWNGSLLCEPPAREVKLIRYSWDPRDNLKFKDFTVSVVKENGVTLGDLMHELNTMFEEDAELELEDVVYRLILDETWLEVQGRRGEERVVYVYPLHGQYLQA